MRGYIKVTSCLLALSMMASCELSNPINITDIKVQVKEMNLDGAKAMAHLKNGNPGTKASLEFGQEEALYLVYDNNEIRLPEIKFSVEIPDTYSEMDRKMLMKDIHVTINEPMIKDFGEYIYVFSLLSYYTTFDGAFVKLPQIGVFDGPHSHTLVRKSDGYCQTVNDKIGNTLLFALLDDSTIVQDSQGYAYFISFGRQVSRLYNSGDEVEVESVDILIDNIMEILRRPQLLEYGGNMCVAGSYRTNDWEVFTEYGKVSSDLIYDKVRLDGQLIGFEKYGDNAYLFVIEESTFKVYNASGELTASTVVETGMEEIYLLSAADGLYEYYCNGAIVRFDAKSGECTVSEENETQYNYLSYNKCFCGGKFYVAYSPDEENYVEVLKVDVLKETVEKLKRLDGPEGCIFSGGIRIEDESEGKLLIAGSFIRKDDGMGVEEVNQQIIVPEIAQAYAEANAVKDYGIDFGTYKVVNVVPLTDDLDSSEN